MWNQLCKEFRWRLVDSYVVSIPNLSFSLRSLNFSRGSSFLLHFFFLIEFVAHLQKVLIQQEYVQNYQPNHFKQQKTLAIEYFHEIFHVQKDFRSFWRQNDGHKVIFCLKQEKTSSRFGYNDE